VGSIGRRQLYTYMCEVMSSSDVVVCGTWCAAWDGFFCALLFVFTVYKRCGAVEEPRCV